MPTPLKSRIGDCVEVREMTPELIAGLVGVAFSLGMEYIPWFANWYNALEDVKQRLVPVGLGLVVVYGAFGLGCISLIVVYWPCTGLGAYEALKALLAFYLANQTTYAVFLKKETKLALDY